MIKTAKAWRYEPVPDSVEFRQLKDSLKFDDILTQLLWNRGIRDFEAARRFFKPSANDLHDPRLMKDMDKSVDRLLKAIHNGESILVYGDYDVDGTTSVALVSTFLEEWTDKVACYIPDRYKEGYGISSQGIQFAIDSDVDVIIALDCGIKAYDQAKMAKDNGIDLIVCDHHTPGPELPEAFAILDPKRKDCGYPYKELSGCGVGYKLCQAIAERKGMDESELTPYLDLLVVSIGADIVPITGENRILAIRGLHRLNTEPRPAFRLMMQNARKQVFNITDVVFTIAPRINAAGRIRSGSDAVELMRCKSTLQAQEFLSEINEHNQTRKELDRSITAEALNIVEQEMLKHSTVVYREDWHKGVIGIVASRLIETYFRPTIVLTKSNGLLAGSARSVPGFDLYQALDACSDYLLQFGGHKYAAGMTLEEDDLPKFKKAFDQHVGENITEEMTVPEVKIDAKISVEDINSQFERRLKLFHPHGPENDLPVFSTEIGLASNVKTIGSDRSHLKFEVSGVDCIAFGMAEHADLVQSGNAEMAYHIEYNEFRGTVNLQLRVIDIRECGSAFVSGSE